MVATIRFSARKNRTRAALIRAYSIAHDVNSGNTANRANANVLALFRLDNGTRFVRCVSDVFRYVTVASDALNLRMICELLLQLLLVAEVCFFSVHFLRERDAVNV